MTITEHLTDHLQTLLELHRATLDDIETQATLSALGANLACFAGDISPDDRLEIHRIYSAYFEIIRRA